MDEARLIDNKKASSGAVISACLGEDHLYEKKKRVAMQGRDACASGKLFC